MTSPIRVGWGVDVHRLGAGGVLRLAGVEVESDRQLLGTSDADVAAHAVIDALLGAVADGDLGEHFPSGDPHWHDADSMVLLAAVARRIESAGFRVGNVDLTIVSESVRVSPHRTAMRAALADAVATEATNISVKATTTDGMGFVGRDEGIAALAVATLVAETQEE